MTNKVSLIIALTALFIGCTKNETPAESNSVDILQLESPEKLNPEDGSFGDRSIASTKKAASTIDYSAKAMSAMEALKSCFHQSTGKSIFINTRNPAGFVLEADVTCTGEVARTLRESLSQVDKHVNFKLSRGPSTEKIFFGKKEVVSKKNDRNIANFSASNYTFEGSSCSKEMPDIYSCELKFRMPLTERLEGLIKK